MMAVFLGAAFVMIFAGIRLLRDARRVRRNEPPHDPKLFRGVASYPFDILERRKPDPEIVSIAGGALLLMGACIIVGNLGFLLCCLLGKT